MFVKRGISISFLAKTAAIGRGERQEAPLPSAANSLDLDGHRHHHVYAFSPHLSLDHDRTRNSWNYICIIELVRPIMGDAPCTLLPPTASLPPIRTIKNASVERIEEALEYIRNVYTPAIRGTRWIGQRRLFGPPTSECAFIPPSLPSSNTIDHEDLAEDAFERSYAIRWLTALTSLLSSDDTSVPEPTVHATASLLALCSGTAGAGAVTRQIILPSGSVIRLTDSPLDNGEYASVGAQTWGGACVLAEMLSSQPRAFGLDSAKPVRVLEFGAGTGLVSLALAKTLEAVTGTIIATDFYPAVLENLKRNIADNGPYPSNVQVLVRTLDWKAFPATFDANASDADLAAPCDALFGADIVYELEHAQWLRACAMRLLKRPSANEDPRFHLVIPLRLTHAAEARTVEDVFPLASSNNKPELDLVIVSKDVILCAAERGEEVEYVYYSIGWR
jgi:predicted nicotinamide N-methyase